MVWRDFSIIIIVALNISCGGEAPHRPIPSKGTVNASKNPSSAQGDSDFAKSPMPQTKGYDEKAIGYKLLMKNCLQCHEQIKDKEFFKTISKSSYNAILQNRMPKNNNAFLKSNDKNVLLNWLATEFSAGRVVN